MSLTFVHVCVWGRETAYTTLPIKGTFGLALTCACVCVCVCVASPTVQPMLERGRIQEPQRRNYELAAPFVTGPYGVNDPKPRGTFHEEWIAAANGALN